MNKLKVRDIIFLITYTILLVALLIKLDAVISVITQLFLLLSPLVFGGMVAFVLKRPYDAMLSLLQRRIKQKGMAQALAMLAVYLGLTGIFAVIVAIVLPQLAESCKMLAESAEAALPAVAGWVQQMMRELSLLGEASSAWSPVSAEGLIDMAGRLLIGAMPQLFDVTGSVLRVTTNIVIGLVFSVYLLLSREMLSKSCNRLLKAYLNERFYCRVMRIAGVSNEIFTRFVTGQLTEAMILGGMCFVGMVLLRLEYALLISVLVGVTSLIPIVGAFIGAVPAVFILLMISPQKALIFIIFLVALQQFEGNVIYPRVVGGTIGLPAFWIFTAITLGGGMGGVTGMLLAVPVTSIIYRLLGEEVEARLKPPQQNEEQS